MGHCIILRYFLKKCIWPPMLCMLNLWNKRSFKTLNILLLKSIGGYWVLITCPWKIYNVFRGGFQFFIILSNNHFITLCKFGGQITYMQTSSVWQGGFHKEDSIGLKRRPLSLNVRFSHTDVYSMACLFNDKISHMCKKLKRTVLKKRNLH